MGDRRLPRRDFFRVLGAAAGGLSLAGCGEQEDPFALAKPEVPGAERWLRGEEKRVATACAQCPAGCGVEVRVVEGRAVKIEGDARSPVNRGGIGPRGLAGLQVLYDPDRIRQPLRRRGARGTGPLEPVSWEAALAELGDRLKSLRDAGAPERLALVTGRERGVMVELLARFAAAFGTPNFLDGGHGPDRVTATAVGLMQGVHDLPAYDWRHARYVVSLGSALLDSSCQLVAFARAQPALRRNPNGVRATVVHFGSWRSRSAMNTDEWIPIRHGSQGALALGLAHVLVRDGTFDRAFVEQHGFGFEEWSDEQGRRHRGFADLAREWDPERVAAASGVPPAVLERVARELVAQRPAFVIGGAEELTARGGLHTAMAVHALNALLGAIDRPGGLLTQRPAPLADWPALELDEVAERGTAKSRLDGTGSARPRCLGSALDALPAALLAGAEPPIDTLLLDHSNPLYARPGAQQWQAALARVPFVVSFSPFLDETVEGAADLVLPDHTYLERWEDAAPAASVGHPVFGIRQPVVAPLLDTRHSGDVVIALAKRIGEPIAAAFPFDDFKAALLKRVVGLHNSKRGSIVEAKGSDFLKKLYEQGSWSDPDYQFEQWEETLRTPSGKFEFHATTLAKELGELAGVEVGDVDALCLPAPVVPAADAAAGTLSLITFRGSTYAEGGGANLPWLRAVARLPGRPRGPTEAELHPDTARALGIADGDRVEIASAAGRIETTVHVNAGVERDLVLMAQGGGHTAMGRFAKGRGANVLRLFDGGCSDLLAAGAARTGVAVALRRLS